MDYFVRDAVPPFSEELSIEETPLYIRADSPYVVNDHQLMLTFYVMSLGRDSWLVTTCFLHRMDPFLKGLADPKASQLHYKNWTRIFPVWGELMDNAINQRYSRGSLVRFQDPDDSETKWFLGIPVGNLHLETIGDMFNNERMSAAMDRVLARSLALEVNLASASITNRDKLRTYAEGAALGMKEALAWEAKMLKALNWSGLK